MHTENGSEKKSETATLPPHSFPNYLDVGYKRIPRIYVYTEHAVSQNKLVHTIHTHNTSLQRLRDQRIRNIYRVDSQRLNILKLLKIDS